MAKPIRILVADDHTIVRMGIVSLLETEADIQVVGEAEDGRAAVRLAESTKPNVVLMDLMMPILDGASATRDIHAKHPDIKILILTTSTSSDEIKCALDSGASGVVSKNAPFSELVNAIRNVIAGKTVITQEINRILKSDPPVTQLSPRQSEILQLIAKGLSNPDIAKLLNISLYTVKEQVNILLTKLGAANRAEAATIALRKHLLKI